LFHGTFQWHQGIEVAIDALPIVLHEVPGVELHLYGGGAGGKKTTDRLAERARINGVGSSVRFFGGVPLQQIPEIVVNADLGIVPKRADSFGNEAYSTKIMEFMSQAVPVVVSRTKVDSYYFDKDTVEFFESGNAEDMARAIISVLTDTTLRERLVRNGLAYVDANGWEGVQAKYFDLVDGLQCGVGR
jgi:glycosyltransferase involved in cell wall biosynthesis